MVKEKIVGLCSCQMLPSCWSRSAPRRLSVYFGWHYRKSEQEAVSFVGCTLAPLLVCHVSFTYKARQTLSKFILVLEGWKNPLVSVNGKFNTSHIDRTNSVTLKMTFQVLLYKLTYWVPTDCRHRIYYIFSGGFFREKLLNLLLPQGYENVMVCLPNFWFCFLIISYHDRTKFLFVMQWINHHLQIAKQPVIRLFLTLLLEELLSASCSSSECGGTLTSEYTAASLHRILTSASVCNSCSEHSDPKTENCTHLTKAGPVTW